MQSYISVYNTKAHDLNVLSYFVAEKPAYIKLYRFLLFAFMLNKTIRL